MLAATWPDCVDLGRLPAEGPLANIEYGIVDGETFDGRPTRDHALRPDKDPRHHTDARWAQDLMERAAVEVIEEVTRSWPAVSAKT